jgi:hypothetical protein
MAERFGLPGVRRVTAVAGGVINRSFLFELTDGAMWVCRVDVDHGRGKLAREAAAYRWLWQRAPGLPIASAYHVDPAWDLMAWHGAVIENVLKDRAPFTGLLREGVGSA